MTAETAPACGYGQDHSRPPFSACDCFSRVAIPGLGWAQRARLWRNETARLRRGRKRRVAAGTVDVWFSARRAVRRVASGSSLHSAAGAPGTRLTRPRESDHATRGVRRARPVGARGEILRRRRRTRTPRSVDLRQPARSGAGALQACTGRLRWESLRRSPRCSSGCAARNASALASSPPRLISVASASAHRSVRAASNFSEQPWTSHARLVPSIKRPFARSGPWRR